MINSRFFIIILFSSLMPFVSAEIIGKTGFSDFKALVGENEYTFKSVTESKWNGSIGYQITPNTLWSISLSDINGNSSYLKNNSMQFFLLNAISLPSAPANPFHPTTIASA